MSLIRLLRIVIVGCPSGRKAQDSVKNGVVAAMLGFWIRCRRGSSGCVLADALLKWRVSESVKRSRRTLTLPTAVGRADVRAIAKRYMARTMEVE